MDSFIAEETLEVSDAGRPTSEDFTSSSFEAAAA
jgi:hypothetical protein